MSNAWISDTESKPYATIDRIKCALNMGRSELGTTADVRSNRGSRDASAPNGSKIAGKEFFPS